MSAVSTPGVMGVFNFCTDWVELTRHIMSVRKSFYNFTKESTTLMGMRIKTESNICVYNLTTHLRYRKIYISGTFIAPFLCFNWRNPRYAINSPLRKKNESTEKLAFPTA